MPDQNGVRFNRDYISTGRQQTTSDQSCAGAHFYDPRTATQPTRLNQPVVDPPGIVGAPSLIPLGIQPEQQATLATAKFR
jgi:hypothetical protein